MGFMDAVFGKMAPPGVKESVEIQMAAEPEDPAEIPKKLFQEFEKRDNWMRPVASEWRESLAFSRGDHWIKYNAQLFRWEQERPLASYPKPKINAYENIRRTIVSHLTRNRPKTEVLPLSSSAHDVEAARTCNVLVDYLYDLLDVGTAMAEMVTWAFHTNNVYCRPRWDPNRGELIPLEVPPELAGAEGQQVPQFTREGQLVLDIISPFAVYPSKEVRSFEEATDLIMEHLMTPEQLREMFPNAEHTKPDTTAAEGTSFLLVQEESQAYIRGDLEYIRVLEQWFLPSPKYPSGRHVICSKDEMLADEPFPFATFPIVHMQIEKFPMSYHGRSFAWDLKSPQRTLNSAWGHLLHHMDIVVNQPIAYDPKATDKKEIQKRPGALIPFDSVRGGPPQMMQMASLPQWIQEFPDRCQTVMSNLSVSEIMQGRMPYSGMSGRTIAFMTDLDATRLGPWAHQLAKFLGKIFVRCLELYRDNAPESKTVQLTGGSVAETATFNRADLQWGDVKITESSMLPQPAAVKREALTQLLQLQVITPEEFRMATKGAQELEDADPKREDRSWAKDNIALIRMGQTPYEAEWMDYPVHFEVTQQFMKGAEFRRFDTALQDRFSQWWSYLKSKIAEQQAMMQPPVDPNAAPGMVGSGEEAEEAEGEGENPELNGAPKANWGVDAAEETGLGMGQIGNPNAIPEIGG